MIAGIVVAVAVAFAMIYSGKPKHNNSLSYNTEIDNIIERIYQIAQQIRNINEMLTEIELSDGDRVKNFSQEFTTAVGKKISVDVWADGQSATTMQLKELAETRLEELATSLFEEIKNLDNAITKT